MTDMRATERLLEVIEECTFSLDAMLTASMRDGLSADAALTVTKLLLAIDEAITELRRRGDTLVRRDDLIMALENDHNTNRIYPMGRKEGKTYRMARARLENAIGGKP